jgi:AcrR family transcriptional regulator
MPKQTPARGEPGADADSRARILDAAERLFAANGFDATAVSKISKAAHVPKGLVFYYFPAKTDLLVALVNERSNQAHLDESAGLAVHGDVPATLRRVAGRFEEWNTSSYTARRILVREAETHPEVRSALAAVHDTLAHLVRDSVTAATGTAMKPSRLAALADCFVSALLQGATRTHLGLPGWDTEAIAELLGDAVAGRPAAAPNGA